MAKITLIGLYNYLEGSENPLFKNLTMPDGIDKDLIADTILLKGGEFEVAYPDADFMVDAIGIWSRKWQRTFTKWLDALALEYNPIENYDRVEETTITDNGTSSRTDNASDSSTVTRESDGTSTDTSVNTGSSSVDNKISAYNSDTMQNDNSSTGATSNNTSGSTVLHNEGSDITTGSHEATSSGITSNTQIHTSRIHGNIGVTTSSALLLEALSAAEWNLYEHITDIFLREFVIPVY